MPSASGWDGFRRIEIRRRVAGPSALIAAGEHWATIARRVAARGPRWAFSPRLPGGHIAAGPFCDFELQSASPAGARIVFSRLRSGMPRVETADLALQEARFAAAKIPFR
jgi:hypothetical protein